MPKVGQVKVQVKSKVMRDVVKPEYRTAPWPDDVHTRDRRELLNQQVCRCGHDRLCHSCFEGEGADRLLIVDAPHVGECCAKFCPCDGFVMDPKGSPVEGRVKYNRERELYDVVPPSLK